jgi:PKD repeat protein
MAQEPEPTRTPNPAQSLERIGLPPTVSLVVFPAYGVAPLTVGCFADIDDPLGEEVVSYYWNFGDGNVSTLPPPLIVTNTYKNPGTYLVTLRLVTADGRAATAVAGVTVRTNPEGQ